MNIKGQLTGKANSHERALHKEQLYLQDQLWAGMNSGSGRKSRCATDACIKSICRFMDFFAKLLT